MPKSRRFCTVIRNGGGARALDADQSQHGQAAISVWGYLTTSQFWFESMQNWQSEFIVVAAIVDLSIFLWQKGSAESNLSPNLTGAPARSHPASECAANAAGSASGITMCDGVAPPW
jgi:hypothetical protein